MWERLRADVPGAWYADIKALLPAVETWLRDGDVVLVKSSNGTGLTNVVRLLSGQLLQPPVQQGPSVDMKLSATVGTA